VQGPLRERGLRGGETEQGGEKQPAACAHHGAQYSRAGPLRDQHSTAMVRATHRAFASNMWQHSSAQTGMSTL
jgi:hypothetical protein